MKCAAIALALQGASGLVAPRLTVKSSALNAATLEVAPATSEALQTAANEARGLAMDSIAAATPGHPGFPNSEHTTPGIEATTGPLGAGISNCAGLAAASKMSAAMFNTPEHTIFDNHIFCMVGDGCLQEGVSAEASCFAAHEKLDNLIVLYDANDVTLDKMAEFTQSEDVGARYEAYGWDVITLTDGHDLKAIYEAIEEAKANDNGKPTMIIAKTEIGRGIDEVAGTNAAHGEARKNLGLPPDKWHVSDDTYKFFADRKAAQKSQYDAWQATYKAWQAANPDQAKILQDGIDGKTPSEAELLKAIPKGSGEAEATRISGSAIINDIAAAMPPAA